MEREIKTGEYFNGLLILRKFRGKLNSENHTRALVEFKCPCGKINQTREYKVQSGKVKSCGCRLARSKFPKNTPLIPQISPISRYYNMMIHDSNVRGIEFTLTKKEFEYNVNLNCHYCGTKGSRVIKHGGLEGIYIGLDRVNNKQGYHNLNIKPCCTDCNMAKGKKTTEEFFNWLNRIQQFQSNQGV